MGIPRPDRAALRDAVVNAFPKLSRQEGRISLHIYRLLAEGQPVSQARLASVLDLPIEVIDDTIGQWPAVYRDEENRIIGYRGLALREMAHRFMVNGRTLYTWCAWDTLFIPAILNQTARVESVCPETGRVVRLTVEPQGFAELDPLGAVVSFVTPEAIKVRENLIASFCHYVHFFASPGAANKWVAAHPGTFALSMDEAFTLGRQQNAARYGDLLGEAT